MNSLNKESSDNQIDNLIKNPILNNQPIIIKSEEQSNLTEKQKKIKNLIIRGINKHNTIEKYIIL